MYLIRQIRTVGDWSLVSLGVWGLVENTGIPPPQGMEGGRRIYGTAPTDTRLCLRAAVGKSVHYSQSVFDCVTYVI